MNNSFLPGCAPHEAQIGAQIGKTLPAVARHFADQRSFAVDDFVVRKRQDEILGERVEQPEGHVVVMVLAMDRILGHVIERVVHPSHVPFVGKAQPAARDRPAHPGPCRGFFRDHDRAGATFGDHRVEVAEKSDRFEVFAAAVDVRHPFAFAAAVIAIKHRGDGIDAQPVDVKMLQPIKRAGNQEALNFAAAEIVDVGIPIVMKALARIEMLVERGAVEARQAVRIGRKMRRHPIQNDADAGGMQRIDEARKPSGGPNRAAGREHAERLIAPGAAERMFGHRQKLDMGKFHLDEIGHQIARSAKSQSEPDRRCSSGFSQEPRWTS